MNFISVIVILILFLFEAIWVKEESATYKVALVSYYIGDLPNLKPEGLIDYNTEKYLEILDTITQDIDLIVYPEATLDDSLFSVANVDLYTTVPDPEEMATPCRAADGVYPAFFKTLSCAARRRKVNMVVNVVEKEKCDPASGHCADYGYNLYNTNVMFNRRGMIVARYRKFHLFGEYPKNTTVEPDYTIVSSDFGVDFGFFTCFDILFQKPPMELVKRGVKHFIFPTLWFSELPFLTALQVQQMWSEDNNVVLLAANGNNPNRGSGGSGVYVGENGPTVFDISTLKQSYVLLAEVPKYIGDKADVVLQMQPSDSSQIDKTSRNTERHLLGSVLKIKESHTSSSSEGSSVSDTQGSDNIDILAKQMDTFKFLQDEMQEYKSVVIDFKNNVGSKVICDGEGDDQLCCNFKYQTTLDKSQLDPELNHYTYQMAAFSGRRTFAGVSYGGIQTCAVLACLDGNVTTCGKRFKNYSDITWPLTFDYIKIEASYTNVETKHQFPNSLLSSIRPIDPSYTTWEGTVTEGGAKIHRKHHLNQPQNRLMTFAIYGRDYAKDQVIPTTKNPLEES